jgi:hypothetical protein
MGEEKSFERQKRKVLVKNNHKVILIGDSHVREFAKI